MKINIIRRKTASLTKFTKEEWAIADRDHYGKTDMWNTKTFYLKATVGKEIIGSLHLKTEGGIGEIPSLIVSHKRTRQGVGRALIKKAGEIAKNEGAHKLYLLTGENWGALKFYKSLGFIECGQLDDFYLHVDFVVLVKTI